MAHDPEQHRTDATPHYFSQEILEGDFRDMHKAGGDPAFQRALEFVRADSTITDTHIQRGVVDELYLEMSRSDAAFKAADVIPDLEQRIDAYKQIVDFFGRRFHRIVHPEQFTDEQ